MDLLIDDDFIKLGQAMKLAGLVSSGVEAKIEIEDGNVLIDGEPEYRRGKKLYCGDSFVFRDDKVTVKKVL